MGTPENNDAKPTPNENTVQLPITFAPKIKIPIATFFDTLNFVSIHRMAFSKYFPKAIEIVIRKGRKKFDRT